MLPQLVHLPRPGGTNSHEDCTADGLDVWLGSLRQGTYVITERRNQSTKAGLGIDQSGDVGPAHIVHEVFTPLGVGSDGIEVTGRCGM